MHTRRGILGRGLAALGLAGGGGLLAGCEDTSAAYAAWTGPPETLDGPDPRPRLIAWARLAPSSHNLQPWRLVLDDDGSLRLHADPQRLHPATDPHGRQTMVSQGAFLELLALAAAADGYTADVTLFPEGPVTGPEMMPRRPVARIRLRPAPVEISPLFAAVRRRRSTKAAYTGGAITAGERRDLAEAVAAVPGVGAGFVDRGPAMERLRALVMEGMRAEMQDPAALAEIARVVRLAPGDVAAHRDGIVPLPGLSGWVAGMLFGRASLADPDSFMTRSGLRQMAAWAESTTAFVWVITPRNDRAAQVAAGRAYMRLDLAAAAAGVAIHPLSQVLQEVPAQSAQYTAVHALLAGDGGTVQMLARLGHVHDLPDHTPRRAVADLVGA